MSKDILFESNWGTAKTKLTEGLNGHKKAVMETLLDNTRKYLVETATSGATTAGSVATLNKVILPVIRRVMPGVIANEIIGVQPLSGPVGQIHTLRVRYADTIPANGTGVVAGAEALSPFDIARYYTGNENITTPKANATSTMEGRMGNKLSIQIVRETVEVLTRKIAARWTFEAQQDAQSQHGVDIEAEIMAALAQEITAEIDQEILLSLRALSGSAATTWNQAAVSGTAVFVGDEHASLATLINRNANLIAQRTRRGAGNWCVVSPLALTVLQSATTSAFARTTEGTFEAPTNVKFSGTLNSVMKVYVDTYAADDEVVLVGYKGSEVDCAAYYCPYVPLMSSGTVMDPNTGELVTSFMTRYGYKELTNTASSFGNAADYLSSIGINSTNAKFF